MSTLGERIKKARLEAGLSQDALAQAISQLIDKKTISRTTITQWESSRTKEIEASHLLKATKVLNVTPDWLQFGQGNMRPDHSNFSLNASIPLLSYAEIDSHMTEKKEASFYVGLDPQLAKVASPASFALAINDNSMVPLFVPGDIIIIDPGTSPRPGEFVAVKLKKQENRIVFRKYRPYSHNGYNTFDLLALNEDWEKITIHDQSQGEIIGTLIEHRCKRRIYESEDSENITEI